MMNFPNPKIAHNQISGRYVLDLFEFVPSNIKKELSDLKKNGRNSTERVHKRLRRKGEQMTKVYSMGTLLIVHVCSNKSCLKILSKFDVLNILS